MAVKNWQAPRMTTKNDETWGGFQLPNGQQGLLISENRECIYNITNALTADEHHVVQTKSAIEAHNYCRNQKFDFILCDYKVKHMSGWSLVKALKNDVAVFNTPVMMFSNDEDKIADDVLNNQEMLQEYGICALMQFPFDRQELRGDMKKTMTMHQDRLKPEYHFSKAKLAVIREQYDDGLRHYGNIENLKSDTARLHVGYGQIAALQENSERQHYHAEMALELDHENTSASYILFDMAAAQRDVPKQMNIVDRMISENDRESAMKLYQFGSILYKHQCYQDAIRLVAKYRHFISHPPDFLQLLRAKCYLHMRQYDAVAQIVTKLQKRKSDVDADVYNLNAILEKRQGRYDKALYNFQKALDITPGDYRIMYNMSLVYKSIGDIGSAKAFASRALKLAPEFKKAERLLQSLIAPKVRVGRRT